MTMQRAINQIRVRRAQTKKRTIGLDTELHLEKHVEFKNDNLCQELFQKLGIGVQRRLARLGVCRACCGYVVDLIWA